MNKKSEELLPEAEPDQAGSTQPAGEAERAGNGTESGSTQPAGEAEGAGNDSESGSTQPAGEAEIEAPDTAAENDRSAATKGKNYEQIYQLPVKEEETPAERAGWFQKLGIPSILYALLYTICMYKNSSGITMPVWIAGTIVYAYTCMKRLDGTEQFHLKKGSGFYIAVMGLLGLSTFLTDNSYVITLNHAGFFVLLVAFLLHNFYSCESWDLEKNLQEMFMAVFGAIGLIPRPFSDGIAYYQERKQTKNKTLYYVFLGILAAVPCLLLLGWCLVSADAVFSHLVIGLFSNLKLPSRLLHIMFMLAFGFFSSYCGIRFLAHNNRSDAVNEHQKYEPVIAITFTVLLAGMYLVFCLIQIVYLFAGHGQLPDHMSYSQYARIGFFQLLFVCVANFCMVRLIQKFFREHKILNGLLLLLCGCTYIMIASSAYRMLLYIKTYHLTLLRLAVLAALLTLAFLMLGLVLTIWKKRFALFRYSALVVSLVYLAFSFAHVDYFIASYNLAQAEQNAWNMDWQYLSYRSADAAPAIAAYLEKIDPTRRQELEMYAAEIAEGKEFWDEDESNIWYGKYCRECRERDKKMPQLRGFNLSRYLSRQYLP